MAVTTTAPVLVSELATRLGTVAEDINSLWAQEAANTWVVSYLAYEIGSAESSFAVTDVPVEVVALTGEAAVDLSELTGGRAGMIKVLIADDDNITVKHDASHIVLVGGADLPMNTGDVLILINRGGDPTALTDGYWREVTRTLF